MAQDAKLQDHRVAHTHTCVT